MGKGFFMEFLSKNIHMNITKSQAISQITVEDDLNLSEMNPDLEKIILEEGKIKIDEVKVTEEHVRIRGHLDVEILYITDDRDYVISKMNGKISFEEQMYLEQALSGVQVLVDSCIEDLSIGIVNSRKLSVRGVVMLKAKQQVLEDLEICTEPNTNTLVQYRRTPLEYTQITVCKKDIHRIRQEIELPTNMPNLFRMIWHQIRPCGLEFYAVEGAIELKGELEGYFIYEGEGEERPIRFFDQKIEFRGRIEEKNCHENMVLDIDSRLGSVDVEIKPDFDGEERVLALEAVLELDIKLYQKEKLMMLSDLYSTQMDVDLVTQSSEMKMLATNNYGKCRVNGKINLIGNHKPILQLLCAYGTAILEENICVDGTIKVNGYVAVKCLYVTNDDRVPFDAVSGKIPFSYEMDAKGDYQKQENEVMVELDHIQATMEDGETILVAMSLNVKASIYETKKIEVLTDVQIMPINPAKKKKLPQIIVYYAKEGEDLWKIGKQFYVSVEELKERNHLEKEECYKGQKILILR